MVDDIFTEMDAISGLKVILGQESVEMLRYYQAIKGFDKPDFYEVVSIYQKFDD